MSIFDKVKSALKGKGDQIDSAIDKAADVVDEKTGGKHTDKIDKVVEKAKDAANKLDE